MVAQPRREPVAQAEERLRPYLDRLRAAVLERYPQAVFSLEPGPEPDSWLLNARIPADDDPELERQLAALATEFLVEHHVDITTIPLPRSSRTT